MYRLVFLTGKLKGKRLVIQEKAAKAGRDPDCVIRLSDEEASRRHALFEEREDGVYIKDLGSTNSLLVNDKPIVEARLRHGDRIELGSTLLQYQVITRTDEGGIQSIGHMQTITTLAVGLVIFSQLAFLLYLVARHKDAVRAPEPPSLGSAARTEGEAAAPAMTGTDDTMAQAESLLLERQEAQRAAPPPPEPDPQMMEDIRMLRSEVEDLRRQVADPGEAATAPVEATEPAAEPDPLTQRAHSMLKEAAADIGRLNFVQADEKLARIQLMAPDFIPAYIERARLHEQRGLIRQAGEQWTEVLNRTMGTPLYEQAAAERIRLARMEMIQRTAPAPAPEGRAARPTGKLPRRIRIADVTQERFQKNEQFEEMRLLRIALKPRSGERDLDAYHIQVAVTFFDENTETREARPTRAVVPRDPLRADGEWRPNQEKQLTAAYIIPSGFREQELDRHGEQMLYLGYVIQVFYRQELQDVEARPKHLIEKLHEIPSPFH